MRILALETTERQATLAAFDNGSVISSESLSPHTRSAQSLAPGMRDLFQQVGWTPQEVDLVAVSNGPGSFTGLRVGVTTAKTFAYAVGAEVLAVNTLEAIANQAPDQLSAVQVVLDAQRQQIFCGALERDSSNAWQWIRETRIMDNSQWLDSLESGQVVTGPALRKLASELPDWVEPVAEEFWAPTAAAVAQVAWRHYGLGQRDDLWGLVPQYFRKSAAEEKLEE